MDVNKCGLFSCEDFEITRRWLADCGGLTKVQADLTSKQFLRIVDSLNVKPGEKIPLDEAMQQASEATFEITTCKYPKVMMCDIKHMLFDVIDINNDGRI